MSRRQQELLFLMVKMNMFSSHERYIVFLDHSETWAKLDGRAPAPFSPTTTMPCFCAKSDPYLIEMPFTVRPLVSEEAFSMQGVPMMLDGISDDDDAASMCQRRDLLSTVFPTTARMYDCVGDGSRCR